MEMEVTHICASWTARTNGLTSISDHCTRDPAETVNGDEPFAGVRWGQCVGAGRPAGHAMRARQPRATCVR
jgi:hypothetical protein